MSIDIITLQCFAAVSSSGSFTKAAESLGRTQSAVSQQMSKLENILGKSLWVRNKTLTLSHDGEIFLGYTRQILSLYCEALDRFREPELEGEVRFGLPEDFASVFLSDVLADFARLHPRILLNVECDLTLNLFERFKKKEFDLVLVKMNQPEDFPNGLDIWSETLEWVGNSSLIFHDKPIPLVLSPQPCVYRNRAISALENIGRKWRIVFSSHSFAGTIAAVKAGMGVTVLPRNMVSDELEIIRRNQFLPDLDDTHISLLKHQNENAVINSFQKFVLEKLKP